MLVIFIKKRETDGAAILIYDEDIAIETGYDFAVESLPAGEGLVYTDGKTLWRETTTAEIPQTDEDKFFELAEMMLDQECRLIALELGV